MYQLKHIWFGWKGHQIVPSNIVKNFANFTLVSHKLPTLMIRDIITDISMLIGIDDIDIHEHNTNNMYKVLLNGIWLGVTEEHEKVITQLLNKRSRGAIPDTVSISENTFDKEINIYCDAGRMIRPLYYVNKQNKLLAKETDGLSWDDLVQRKHIRYLDTYEIEIGRAHV